MGLTGSNPTRASNLFKHLVGFGPCLVCTLIAQCFQELHRLQRTFWHIFDVVTFGCRSSSNIIEIESRARDSTIRETNPNTITFVTLCVAVLLSTVRVHSLFRNWRLSVFKEMIPELCRELASRDGPTAGKHLGTLRILV